MQFAIWLHVSVFLLAASLILSHPAITTSIIEDVDGEADKLNLEDVNVDPGPAKVEKYYYYCSSM